ncbi:MAG: TRAP transporter substrate-binding protein [Bacteroidota bacterium]
MAKLSRKNFFRGLALGTISLPFAIRILGGKNTAQQQGGPSILSGDRYRWKMVTTWPPNFPVLGEGCTLFANWVRELSGGRMDIRVYGGGELVPPLEAFDAVRSGAAEIGSGAAYYWAGKDPATQFFASVPFGMNAQQLNAWIICGGGMELWRELYAEYGLVPLLGGNTGVQMGGWFNREINSLEDLRGLKMRMPGLGGKVLEKAGGAPVLLPGGDLYTGLERGVIDATEWIGPYHDYKMGFHQIAKYYYTPGWHETGTALEFFINKQKYDLLPADLQAILEAAALRLNGWMLSEFETQNSIYLQKLVQEEKVDIRRYPEPVLRQLREYTEEIITEITDRDPFSKKVYESYRQFRQRATAWSDLTEKVYYNDIQI